MQTYLIVLIGFLAFMLLLGFAALKKSKKGDVADYFVVKRSMGLWFVVGTYGASFISSGTMIGSTSTIFSLGLSYCLQWAGAIGGVFYLSMVLVPKFWRYGYYNDALSMPDLFGERYSSKWSRSIFSIVILVCYTCGIAAMFLGMNAVWGLISNLDLMVIAVISAIVILLYSLVGGARGVAWTDTLCMGIITVSVLMIMGVILGRIDGLASLVEEFGQSPAVEGSGWMSGNDLVAYSNSYYTPIMTFAWALIWFLGNSSQPHQVTRAYLAKDEKTARMAIGIAILIFAIINFATVVVACYARVNLDIAKADYAFPATVVELLPKVLGGIVLVAIVAAIFSTCSTMLIISGQCIGYDIYKKLVNPEATDKKILSVSRVAMVIISIISIIITYFAQTVPSLLFLWSGAFAIMGASIAPSLLSAFYWKGATAAGNIASMLTGMGVSILLYAVPSLKPFGLHPLLPAIILSTLVLVVVSKCSKPSPQETLDKFYNPLVRYGEQVAKKKGLI